MLILSLDVCRSYHVLMGIVWDTGLVIVVYYFKNHSDPLFLKYLNSQSLLETNINKKTTKHVFLQRFAGLIVWFLDPLDSSTSPDLFFVFQERTWKRPVVAPVAVKATKPWVKSKGINLQKMPEAFRFGNYTNLPQKNGKSPLKKHLGTFFRLRKYCNLICPSAICGGGAPHTQEKKH